MAGTQPVAVYALRVPPGDLVVPAVPDFAAMFRVSMAAIDPEEEYEEGSKSAGKPLRSTLKIIRSTTDILGLEDDSDDLDSDEDEDLDDDEELNGGPSDPSKSIKAKTNGLVNGAKAGEDESDDDADSLDDEAAAQSALKKLMKGKAKAIGDEADEDDDDKDEGSLDVGQEIVVCTLDPEQHYQQPLDLVVAEGEQILFKVTGTHTVHLTGNYVIPLDDAADGAYGEDSDEYDLSPDDDELEGYDSDEEEDELDGLEDPRVMEVDTEEEEIPKLVNVKEPSASKGKNKRPAKDSSDEEETNLDDLMAKSLKPAAAESAEEPKLSKKQLKKLKKQKRNDGQAVEVGDGATTKQSISKKEPSTNGEKKVQFAENLEQGPTPSPAAKAGTKSDTKPDTPANTTGSLGIKKVNGVTTDDRKLGKGPAAKKGDRVNVRYIGKLADSGKVFDANKKGKPFSFKVGAGDVIKGWDIGIVGMTVGSERRITVPANQGYGAKGMPPTIPANSTLVFDVKMLEIK